MKDRPAPKGRPHVVGEKGPEFIVPGTVKPTGGFIRPASAEVDDEDGVEGVPV